MINESYNLLGFLETSLVVSKGGEEGSRKRKGPGGGETHFPKTKD